MFAQLEHRTPTTALLKRGIRTFQKLSHLWDDERWGINLKRAGRSLCTNGGALTFCHFTFLLYHIYGVWGKSKVPFITFWILSLSSWPCRILIQLFIVLKPGIICTFLIHSVGIQKMLTALFNLVSNTQISKWTIFLSAQARCFLVLKRF